MIIVDHEFAPLLETYRSAHPNVPIIVDTDIDATEGQLTGPFDNAVLEGLKYDQETGAHGWERLEGQAADEESVIALAYTSGTTAKPKGVEYTHRGSYLAALGNVIESGLNYHRGRAKYLWTLPMFHAMGSSTFHLLTMHQTVNQVFRVDIPVGCNGRPWDPLLSSQDRLPGDLAVAQTGRHYSLQRGANSQHPPLQCQRSRETSPSSPRHGGS